MADEIPAPAKFPGPGKRQGRRPGPLKPGHNVGVATRWKKGQSGNPAGVSKLAAEYKQALEQGLPPDALARVVAAIREAAEGGDMTAAKIVLERTVGPIPEAPKVSVNVINVLPAVREIVPTDEEGWDAEVSALQEPKP